MVGETQYTSKAVKLRGNKLRKLFYGAKLNSEKQNLQCLGRKKMLSNYGKDYRAVIPPGWSRSTTGFSLPYLTHNIFLTVTLYLPKAKQKNTYLHLLSTTLRKNLL